MKEFTKDKLNVKIMSDRTEMGKIAACDIGAEIKRLLKEKECINMVFAAAPSQDDVLKSLTEDKEIDWSRINAFHMDEYIGLSKDAPQGFGNYLKAHIFDKVPFKSVNLIDSTATDIESECSRYSSLLVEYPTDIVCMGIGENGHIAFNDPHVAKFDDKELVKKVDLDEKCRQQQVNDGCFRMIDDVPKYALTLSVTALTNGRALFCVVPTNRKAEAVKNTIEGEISEKCPASILRCHKNAVLYLDSDSAGELK